VVASGLAPARAVAPLAASDGIDWPMFHLDASHSGVSAETTIGASNASTMAPVWQANTGTQSYVSPAVVYNATLDERLVYVANQAGVMAAYNAANGDRVWYYRVGAHIQSSPAVDGNVIYFGANDFYLYALDATTGQLLCRFYTGGAISSSPVVADPDGTGKVVYFGDNGLTGADDGGHIWAVNAVDPNAAGDCSLDWMFNGFGDPPGSQPLAGSWSPPAFAVDANGRALIVVGGSSPDNAVYALDAVTGQLAWRFQTKVVTPDNDVGAGPTISAPGVNGFADGVAYVAGKDRMLYALDLTTGALIWQFDIAAMAPKAGGATRSTAVLDGSELFLGYGKGVFAVDAIAGTLIWKTQDLGTTTAEIISSPVVTGAPGDQVLFAGDMSGKLFAFSVATGQQLWAYSTGSFIYGSPVVSGGLLYLAGTNGFLYAFGPGGSTSANPDTAITSPATNSTLPNPSGSLQITGTADDPVAVGDVMVSVKDRNSTKWWDATAGAWSPVFTQNQATLDAPEAPATNWTFSVPIPPGGGVYFAQAEATNDDGLHDTQVPTIQFTVSSLSSPPDTTITVPKFKQVYYFPNGVRQAFAITITGTATDPGGANPGIGHVYLIIKNREHDEYFCGPGGCKTPGGESPLWSPTYKRVEATLDSPGAVSTTWSYTFTTYDHPHSYYIAAWAVDLDKEVDTTRAQVSRFCVHDPGDSTCS
jgi:eukaryotic-like serine/threonine-protein kinase